MTAAPYALPSGPCAIQFSGGRTSGYMLKQILDHYGGTLPPDCHVLFQNTGREMPETLDFIRDCEVNWGVPIVWLERIPWPEWVARVNKTCRASKAIGVNAAVPRYVAAHLSGSILDFGAGKSALHTAALRDQGHDVTAYEIGKNVVPGVHDIAALVRRYDVVMVSNVLNVMPDEGVLRLTLQQIAAACGGVAVFNLPKDPRHRAWSGNAKDLGRLAAIAGDYFGEVEKVGKLIFKATAPVDLVAPPPPSPFKVVDHASASRDGEPFKALIDERKFAPNQQARFCTADLKVNPAREYMIRQGYKRWSAVVGFRADEPHRVARDNGDDCWTTIAPLFNAGVGAAEVREWWDKSPFNLEILSSLSNCDGCFLKSERARAYLARYYPERAKWWADIEAEGRGFVNPNRYMTWSKLLDHVDRQQDWVFQQESDLYCDVGFGGCHD